MQLLKLVTTGLALPASLLVRASDVISSGRATEPQPSDVDLAATDTARSSTDLQSFRLFTGLPVEIMFVYCRRLDGKWRKVEDTEGFIIFALTVGFPNEDVRAVGRNLPYNDHSYRYAPGENGGTFLNMTVYAGHFVDAISYTTETMTVRMGGSGGTPIEQDVGNGILLGFQGTLGEGYLKSVEPIFDHDD